MYSCFVYLKRSFIKKTWIAIVTITILASQTVFAQTIDTCLSPKKDIEQIVNTSPIICLYIAPEVMLQSFSFNKAWQELPAPVTRLDKQISEIATTSLLPSLNTVPGIRMEQRSPESFSPKTPKPQ